MIIDKIENAEIYYALHPKFKQAFEFLKSVKLTDFVENKLFIDGDNIFAILNKYETKESAQLETHEKYIDIQFMIDGEELIGYLPFSGQKPSKEYNSDSDIAFFDETPLFFSHLKPKIFSILYPNDMHMPGIKVGSSSPIIKIVVKVKL